MLISFLLLCFCIISATSQFLFKILSTQTYHVYPHEVLKSNTITHNRVFSLAALCKSLFCNYLKSAKFISHGGKHGGISDFHQSDILRQKQRKLPLIILSDFTDALKTCKNLGKVFFSVTNLRKGKKNKRCE